MDLVSHLVFGRALAAVTPRPASAPQRGLTAAIVIGSIAPDVDAVLMPFSWDRYLIWHQRGTHALLGTAIDAIVLALILRVLWRHVRRRRRRDGRPGEAMGLNVARVQHLALAAWIGGLGHALLDLVSGGTIRLLAPFSIVPFGVPWTAMADPLLAGPLFAFLLATLVWRRHTRQLAIATLVALAIVIGVKEVSRRRAVSAYARATAARMAMESGDPPPTSSALEAAWGSFTRWWAFDRVGPRLRTWDIDAWTGTVRLHAARDDRDDANDRDDALIEASTRLDTVRHLQRLFDLTFVEVRRRDRETDVLWSDIRFCDVPGCALWFGGTFDASGRVLHQLVIVGTVRQTRAP